ncbi:Non-reducing end beta-L-arabinofuranosidase [Colletotrichum siamense]|uniref:Non-reducing end beta-L-arabinofuranosidase n=1 Tax=Colletotrichum siamense TaxID=690259 RepID=A0A9P5K544_COLSI|nr:Non-reducing end beta-L-arabinofuranosidase [Colletotrichum siamense]KAF4859024.1 Non-reducing end beta-L-arabinofuranosidase [Colletotrichum siamense]
MEVPTRNVEITSSFWVQLRDSGRLKTIPALVKAQKESGHWDCLKWKEGHQPQPHPFWDSDVYKATEAACYFLMTHADEEMMRNVEEAVDNIRGAQHPDGYINSYYTVRGIENRWTNLRDMHELYCIGHLIEACVAYETLTGSGRLLEPVMKVVQHIDSIFGSETGKRRGYPGHQEIEIGLLRLYEMTKDPLLLQVAQYFILERGTRDEKDEIYFDKEAWARGNDPGDWLSFEFRPTYRMPRDYGYHQADRRLADATELVGHSVRAMYFMTAATDLVRLTKHEGIHKSLAALWRDMVDKKMYITGGLGSVRQWEGFGHPYVLGDTEEGGVCYAETCATFGMIGWCQRMLRLNLNSEYADVMEIGLYNGFLGAIGLDGESFYYENPLRTFTGRPKERSRWFEVACCPPNVAKLLGNLGAFIYTMQDRRVAIHLYIESVLHVPGSDAVVTIKTAAPWSGKVEVAWSGTVAIALRIPGWSDGYTADGSNGNGTCKDGYLYLPEGTDGRVEVVFSFKPQLVYANPKLGKNEVCVQRGPLVYCIEDVDNELDIDNVILSTTSLKDGSPLDILGYEVTPVIARGTELKDTNGSKLYSHKPWERGEERDLVFIPYYARANRGGKGGMRVWCFRD